MTYTLFVLPSAEKDLDRLSREVYARVKKTFGKIAAQRCPAGSKKLVGEDGCRIQVGDWRILYRIDDSGQNIYVYRVRHRSEAYR